MVAAHACAGRGASTHPIRSTLCASPRLWPGPARPGFSPYRRRRHAPPPRTAAGVSARRTVQTDPSRAAAEPPPRSSWPRAPWSCGRLPSLASRPTAAARPPPAAAVTATTRSSVCAHPYVRKGRFGRPPPWRRGGGRAHRCPAVDSPSPEVGGWVVGCGPKHDVFAGRWRSRRSRRRYLAVRPTARGGLTLSCRRRAERQSAGDRAPHRRRLPQVRSLLVLPFDLSVVSSRARCRCARIGLTLFEFKTR